LLITEVDLKETPRRRRTPMPQPREKPLLRVSAISTPSPHIYIHFCLEEEDFTTNWDESVEKFDDLGLKEPVLRGIYGYGFVKPSPIQ
jgi:hypothetical protein